MAHVRLSSAGPLEAVGPSRHSFVTRPSLDPQPVRPFVAVPCYADAGRRRARCLSLVGYRPARSRRTAREAMPDPSHPRSSPQGSPQRSVILEPSPRTRPVSPPWLTPGGRPRAGPRRWPCTASLLLVPGALVLRPPTRPPARLRLAPGRLGTGRRGRPDATGGLNTELTMPEPEAEPTTPLFTTLALARPRRRSSPRSTKLAGADAAERRGGGLTNDNPGAGDGDGFGLARFGQGGETIRGVEVKVGDPQFTLHLGHRADLDLHVIEPGGKEIYWEDPKGTQRRRARRRQHQGLRPREHLLAQDEPTAGREGQGPGPARRVQVVRRLLGRLRRHPQADPLEGPDQARGQGHRRQRQAQPAQRPQPRLSPDRRAVPSRRCQPYQPTSLSALASLPSPRRCRPLVLRECRLVLEVRELHGGEEIRRPAVRPRRGRRGGRGTQPLRPDLVAQLHQARVEFVVDLGAGGASAPRRSGGCTPS